MSAWVNRIYANCDADVNCNVDPMHPSGAGNKCPGYEDHLYGKRSDGVMLGEIGFVQGDTPKRIGRKKMNGNNPVVPVQYQDIWNVWVFDAAETVTQTMP